MGTNVFVEGLPAPIVIRVRLPHSPDSFRSLKEVAASLADVDDHLRTEWRRRWPGFEARRFREVIVLRFSLASPLEFSILTDPAWLAVFLTFLTGYRDLKENLPELGADLQKLMGQVRGLTVREMDLLGIAVRMSLDSTTAAAERITIRMAKKLRRFRRAIQGDAGELPEIEVVDIENKRRTW